MSVTRGAAVTDKYERYGSPRLSLRLRQRSWSDRGLETVVASSAAVATLAIAVATGTVLSQHLSFPQTVAIAVIGLAFASLTAAALARLLQDRRPTWAAEQAAIARIHAIVGFLLDRYGMGEPAIHPPVKLVEAPSRRHDRDLERLLERAQSTSSEVFISQIVSRPRCTVILGSYGSGKTSLLLRLTHRLLTDTETNRVGFIPLFFKCRDWSEEYGSFHKWITASAVRSYRIPVHISDYWIRTGKLFVALDGLHEVSPDRLNQFSTEIHSWVQAAEGTRLAISARLDMPSAEKLVRTLHADQICVIQPLPDSDIRRYLQEALSRLTLQADPHRVEAMDIWMQSLVARTDYLRGPALVGLLAEALEESEQLPGRDKKRADDGDPASVAFQVANEFFSHGDFAAAQKAYGAITRLPHSRWHIPAYTLLGTCLYLMGDIDQASEAMLESVALRLQESIQATPEAVEPLSDVELTCLAAVPLHASYDLAQVSSAASLPISRSRQALQILRERGLVETVENTDERARFRRSLANLTTE